MFFYNCPLKNPQPSILKPIIKIIFTTFFRDKILVPHITFSFISVWSLFSQFKFLVELVRCCEYYFLYSRYMNFLWNCRETKFLDVINVWNFSLESSTFLESDESFRHLKVLVSSLNLILEVDSLPCNPAPHCLLFLMCILISPRLISRSISQEESLHSLIASATSAKALEIVHYCDLSHLIKTVYKSVQENNLNLLLFWSSSQLKSLFTMRIISYYFWYHLL